MNNSKTQIVATIGPATKDVNVITQLIENHLNIARLNFSWGTHEEHQEYINNIRKAGEVAGRRVAILQDLSGPRFKEEAGHRFDTAAVEVVSPKDLEDLKFGLDNSVDYVALSYVGSAEDVIFLKDEIKKSGKPTKVIAKIERQVAVDNIDEIIAAADGIMIARGDLSNEVPLGRVPFIQEEIIAKSKAAKKPVITATQMLLSMTENTEPTRAEVTDVVFAVISGSDAVMLSEETAIGKHPVEAVEAMEKILVEAEDHLENIEINPF